MQNEDKFKWLRWNGRTVSSSTGPGTKGDHTTGDENGNFKSISYPQWEFQNESGIQKLHPAYIVGEEGVASVSLRVMMQYNALPRTQN